MPRNNADTPSPQEVQPGKASFKALAKTVAPLATLPDEAQGVFPRQP